VPFSFCEDYYENNFGVKADTLTIDGMEIKPTKDYDRRVEVSCYFKPSLFVKPLFRAYCCVLASIGILEAGFAEPSKIVTLNGEQKPVSMYDCLKTVKITELGLWCLNLGPKPACPRSSVSAIADSELLLVTVKGKSLERKLFLDRIGDKLGEDRWRISPESFIRNCDSKEAIQDRINRFKTLVSSDTAPHWQSLFDKALARAGLFNKNTVEALVFSLPDDPELENELFRGGGLNGIAFRAEGRLLVVPAKNEKKFRAFLSSRGIAWFKQP
jgi:hypothetical protein